MAHHLVPWKRRSLLPVKSEDRDPFMSLQQQMNRLFEEFHRGLGLELPSVTEDLGAWTPRVNVTESDKEICVSAELPGMEEKDVNVAVSKDTLTIRGEKSQEKEEKGRNFFRSERSYGAFHRDIALPVSIEPDKTEAVFKQGVLTITMPKSKEAQKDVKKIQIKKM